MTTLTPTPPDPPSEPARPYGWWDDDPRTCARDDARYWNDVYDRDEES
jgi:hypothetical protein